MTFNLHVRGIVAPGRKHGLEIWIGKIYDADSGVTLYHVQRWSEAQARTELHRWISANRAN